MTLLEVLPFLKMGVLGVVIFFATLIKIPKIEINLWGLLGRAINKEQKAQNDKLQKSIDDLSKRFDTFITDSINYRAKREEKDADRARSDILMFNEELLRSVRHSKERFDNIIERVDEYEDYCDTHPLYKNNKAESAITNIKHVYQKCMDERDFL